MLHISIKEFEVSIHAREITCQDCHTGVINEKHESIKGSGAVDCNQCHDKGNRHGLRSKSTNRPQCYSCHTKHGILEKDNPASSVHARRLKETCRICHKLECGEVDYLSWLVSLQIASHKKQDFGQAYERTNCVGCHQGMAAHGEEDPLNDQDCHKCHLTAAGQSKLMGYIHPRADLEKQPETFAAAIAYQIVAVVLLWGGLRFYVGKFSGKIRDRK